MLKKWIIGPILIGSITFILLGCASNEPSIRIMGINIERYNKKTKKYDEYQTITKKDEIKEIKRLIKTIETEEDTETVTEEIPDYQFNFTFRTKNADIKQITYQIKELSGTTNQLLLGLDGIYRPLTIEDEDTLRKIVMEK